MSHILNRIRELDESNSENVKETISAFIQNLPKATGQGQGHISWLTTLEDVINRFPKYCFSHRSNIEIYLAKFLDSLNCHNVIAAAKCAHLLQQVRPSQEKTATPKTCWGEQMNLLCDSAHALLGAIFPDAVEVYHHPDARVPPESSLANSPLTTAITKTCEIQAVEGDSQDKEELLCARLRNIFIFIQAMLIFLSVCPGFTAKPILMELHYIQLLKEQLIVFVSSISDGEIYPVGKLMRPQSILDVVVRAMTVTTSNLTNLNLYGYSLKIEGLRILEALILCLRSNLLPYSPLIFRIAVRTMHWTADHENEESIIVRIQVYSTLKTWLSTIRCGSVGLVLRGAKGKCLSEQLTDHFVRDITPTTRPVVLTVNAQPTKNLSKKARRKLATTQLQESSLRSHMPGACSDTQKSEPKLAEEVAVAALECLETFLLVTGLFLKPTTHKVVQAVLVRECHRTHEYSSRRALRLCRALDAARKCVASNTAPPTQHCLFIFSHLVTCNDPELSSFCSKALQDIRLHLHSAPPSLNFVAQETREEQVAPRPRNVVSERNRVALEALLGADRMPNATPEEIITIPDEPANKKPRIEDNISISSSSDHDDDDDVEEVQAIVIDEPDAVDDTQEQGDDLEELSDEPIIIEDKNSDTTVASSEIKIIQVETVTPNLHELHTQLPANLSNDTVDGQDSSHSLEIDYDYPNSIKNKVTVLEKLEDENLPSTNETDDIQITCGQLLKSSQDASQKKVDENKENEPKVTNIEVEAKVINGEAESKATNGDVITNGVLDCKDSAAESKSAKNVSNVISVDDMLADFVDEVNEDAKM